MFIMNIGSSNMGEVYLKPDGDVYWVIARLYSGEEKKLIKLIKSPDTIPENTLSDRIEKLEKWKEQWCRYFEEYRVATGDDFKSFEEWLGEQPEPPKKTHKYDTDYLVDNWAYNDNES